jgi:Domain of unknown function (DUF4192)
MGDGSDMDSLMRRRPDGAGSRVPDPVGAADLGVPVGRRSRVARALEQAETRFVARVVQDGGLEPWRRLTQARFPAARRSLARTGRLSQGETAALVVALVDAVTRDRCWARIEADRDPMWITFWLHLARHALPPYRAEPLFLLAWTAWRSGDSGLARRAVDAVLVEEPGHVATGMLVTLLRTGIHPSDLPTLSDRYTARGGAR